MIKITRLPGRYGESAFLGLAMGLVAFIALSKAMVESPWPLAFKHYDQHLAGWLSLRLNSIVPEFFPDIAARYAAYLSALPGGYRPWHLLWRFDVPLLLAGLLGAWITWVVGRGAPDTKIVSGRRLFEGRAAHRELRKRASEECAISGTGLKLHHTFPWSLSLDRETKHILLQGGVGSGKTQILWALLKAAISRGDKLIIYDNKGDFTAGLPDPITLLAPWDERSFAWDIAKDCTNGQDARELAARLIPEGHDPMWHAAARMILSAVIQKLQAEQPGTWTWADLHRLACGNQEDLLSIVTRYQPEAVNLLAGESKTTDGILINLSASLAVVADLAKAWGSAPAEKRFSFSVWVQDPNPTTKTIVLQGNGRYGELTRSYIQGVIAMLAGRINSSEVGESKERRIWLILDEVPQLGKVPGLGAILELGRSRGTPVVLGTQDLAQLQELYGQFIGRTWSSLVSTQLYCRTNAGDTANFIANDVIGRADVEKIFMHEGKPQPPQTLHPLVLEPSEISDILRPTEKGVRAVLLGMGDAFILEWPYTSSPKLREASIEAAWVRGGAQSNKPLPPTGAPSMTTTNMAQPSTESPSSGLPRLKLRAPTPAELNEMASTGSDIRFAPEPLADMQSGADIASGGDK